jgi:hypothetical protein
MLETMGRLFANVAGDGTPEDVARFQQARNTMVSLYGEDNDFPKQYDLPFVEQLKSFVQQAQQGTKPQSPTGKLLADMGALPQGHPDRKYFEDALAGGNEATLSRIGKLRAERDKLPPGDPDIKYYENALEAIGREGPQFDIAAESNLRKEFTNHPEVKSFMLIDKEYSRAAVAIETARKGKSGKGPVDQALIMILNKMLDERSVVRESEYARTPEGMGLTRRAEGYYGRLTEGGAGLNDEEREDIYSIIDKFYEAASDTYNEQVDFYTDLANRYGIPPENIVRLGGIKAGQEYKKKIKTAKDYLNKWNQ